MNFNLALALKIKLVPVPDLRSPITISGWRTLVMLGIIGGLGGLGGLLANDGIATQGGTQIPTFEPRDLVIRRPE